MGVLLLRKVVFDHTQGWWLVARRTNQVTRGGTESSPPAPHLDLREGERGLVVKSVIHHDFVDHAWVVKPPQELKMTGLGEFLIG